MRIGIRRSLLAALLPLHVTACESTTAPNPLFVPALTLEAVGDSRQLTANGAGDALPTWESLNPEIATVTRAGMVTAVAAGTARVRARLGSATAEGQVTVLPPVNVEITSASSQPGPNGTLDVTLRIRNNGGRGYYRMRFYRASAEPGGEPQIVSQMLTDHEIAAGQPEIPSMMPVPQADWVVIYSREPHSIGYRTTACARLDGGQGCPAP